MTLADGTMLKKFHTLLFLNTGTPTVPVWKQIKKSTDNTVTMNPETMTFDYIVDENPTTEIDRYSPSLSQPITMYKGEADYEYLFDKFFSQAVGANAHSQLMIVFLGHDVASSYKAWKTDCVLTIDNMNPVESTITATINFNGTTEKGTAVVTAGVPAFTGDVTEEFLMTFLVQVGIVPEEGATVQVGGVTKLTDEDGLVSFLLLDGETYTVGATNGTESDSEVFVADKDEDEMTLTLV